MTNQELYEQVIELKKSVNPEHYPELVSVLEYYIDEENLESVAYDLSAAIFDADATKAFPKNVSRFLISLYEDMIARGNFDAACDLGALYYKGRFGEIDFKKAVTYYTMAATHGSRQAQENLGYCYYYGRDVEVNYQKAFHYFALGAFDGHLNSLYKIGDMYRNGYYVDKNPEEAFRIYNRCYEALTQEAIPLVGADIMLRMGDCYYEGIGTLPDWTEALLFYQRAEVWYYERLQKGDYLIRRCYEKAIHRQEEIRKKRNLELPAYNWV